MSISIPKEIITEENIDTIEKKLYIEKEKDSNLTKKNRFFRSEKIPFYKVLGNHLHVPFFWGRSYFGQRYVPKDYSDIPFEFEGELREEQIQLKNEAMESLQQNDSCLVSCYPGFGKTIMALKLLQELKKKALIIVNKLVLVQQWKESIQSFLNIDPTIIKGKGSKIKNNSIYIINAINIPKHDFSNLEIGTVIVDECHMILTTVFSQGLFYLTPKYLLGLSATPFRMDGFDSLFDIFFGLFRVHRNLHKEHTVIQVNTKEKIEHRLDKFGNINWNSVIDHQSKSEQRKNMICDYCIKYPDRNILILCKRIEQMDHLHKELQSRGQYSVVFKENDITFDKNCRILISSFQKCGTGFSFNKLNMLILGVDTKDFYLQYLGRVFRTVDVKPLVVDIVDGHILLKSHFRARKKIYLDCGGTIERVQSSE
jgi:hypothetical protein